jgi:hypothetical protein
VDSTGSASDAFLDVSGSSHSEDAFYRAKDGLFAWLQFSTLLTAYAFLLLLLAVSLLIYLLPLLLSSLLASTLFGGLLRLGLCQGEALSLPVRAALVSRSRRRVYLNLLVISLLLHVRRGLGERSGVI